MKKLYFLFLFVMGFVAQAQIVNIPDPAFKARLLSASPNSNIASTEIPIYNSNSNNYVTNYHKIDTNNDGEIQVSEAQAIKYLDVYKNLTLATIYDLTGIEAFTNLIYLKCASNNLNNLDFSQNTALEFLNCNNSQVSSINVSQCPLLKTLSCSNNQLTSLDLSSNNVLTNLYCDNNQLTSLNLSSNNVLAILYCKNNQLTSLNFSSNNALTELYCGYNQLTSLNISQSTGLTRLSCYNNQLTSLDVTQNAALTNLTCNDNQLTSLDVSQNIALTVLGCSINQLTSLNVSQNTGLTGLYCYNNQLTSLDVSQNTGLTSLSCYDNQLTSLDVTQNTALTYLSCKISSGSLNVSQNTLLTYLSCTNSQLTSLDVSQNLALEILYCSSNQLASIDVSNLSNLEYFSCFSNQLTNLDVSQNTALTHLICNGNNLSSLDVTQNTALTHLTCSYNQLTSLDVSQNANLETLACSYNQLVSIDVSQNTNLEALACNDNQLISIFAKNTNSNWVNINFSNNPNIEYVCVDDEDINMVQNKINQYGLNTTCHVNSYCSFTPGGTFYSIEGNNRYDFNTNGCDAGDINFANLKLDISNGTTVGGLIADGTGSYFYDVQQGNYTINPVLENPTYFNIAPTSVTVNFPTQASPFMQDFCVTKTGVHSDVEIALIPTTPARPGFDATYELIFRNKGTEIESGSVTLTYDDSVLDYIQSNPVYSSSATNSFTWNYTNLQPFESGAITIAFNVNSPMETPAVNNGDILVYTATITTQNTDETPTDNTTTLNQTVVGSYDPNDKTCLEGETINPSMIGEYVHYMIRFENTGTYPAENIVVRDDIDPTKFDINTLIPLSGSHEFYTRINGNKVEFIFENINLDFDDATNDGYVAFKIKTLSTLTVNSTISNTAKIYFDYNYPIVTNTATSTYQVLNVQSFEFDSAFTLYPNPVKEVLNLQAKNGIAIQSIEIYNVVGQLVLALPNASSTVDVSSLESGSYFIKINTDNGSTSTKFIKQ
ncbi:T9SS type A sorting domain-containing protein [Flavobacterium chuncheonense]|uniref:T9SS type A sorting domain-containing protein n=1 Tax=Flavobacterium chuncheonense TaxID=2026653 RepID=A0ABW5YJ64_9FLAO